MHNKNYCVSVLLHYWCLVTWLHIGLVFHLTNIGRFHPSLLRVYDLGFVSLAAAWAFLLWHLFIGLDMFLHLVHSSDFPLLR